MTPAPAALAWAALAVWAVATGHVWPAVVALAAIEWPLRFGVRRHFAQSDHERIADLCAIGFLVAMTWQWLGGASHFSEGVLAVLAWLPGLWFPVLLLQRASAERSIPLSALFWSLRRGSSAELGRRRLAFEWPWAALCLLGAACANPRGLWFFVAVVGVGVIAVAALRPRGRGAVAWLVAAGFATVAAFALQRGIVATQARLEVAALEWLRDRIGAPTDPAQTQTAIGSVGRLKLSGRIVWRVGDGAVRGERLQDGVYDMFAYDTWFAQTPDFRPRAVTGDATWVLHDGADAGRRSLRVAGATRSGRALLPLPEGTLRLDALNVGSVEASSLGVVRVGGGPDVLEFDAIAANVADDPAAAPRAADLALPGRLRPTLEAVLREATGDDAQRVTPAALTARLQSHFAAHYAYALQLDTPDGTPRSVERFLTSDRRGHCEYFASATALLLRAAGVPARYATGYVVDEWSPVEGRWLVRARHGHAWAVAWWDGRWHAVDSTPPGWIEADAAADPWWRPATDFASWLRFAWQVRGAHPQPEGVDEGLDARWLLAIVPLAGWVGWSVWRRSRSVVAAFDTSVRDPDPPPPGLIALVDAVGRQRGADRPLDRSVHAWLVQSAEALAAPLGPELADALRGVASRWRALRFDPVVARDAAARDRADDDAAQLARQINRRSTSTAPTLLPQPVEESARPAAPAPRR